MRFRLWHALLFIVALAAFAIARAPAAFFLREAPGAIAYDSVEGTIWSARFTGARFGDLSAGEVSTRLSFLPMLQGKFIADASAHGADLTGDARFLANWNGDRRIVSPNLNLVGAAIPNVGVLRAGVSTAQGVDVFFDDGKCASAAGAVQSDVLVQNVDTLHWRGPPLSGAFACEGDDAVLNLAGSEGTQTVQWLLRLHGDGRGEWRLQVSGATPSAVALLSGFGLSQDGDVMAATGDLRWTPF